MIEEVEFTWGGQCMETIDGLAFIGRNPLDKENVFIATGDSGMGITHGTIAGMLLTDMILGRENPWEKLYDPSRKTLRAAGTFAKENLNVAGQYADWLTPGEVDSVDEITAGSGAVMRRGMTKVAVYRDEHGTAHRALGRLPASGLHRPLEQRRDNPGTAPATAPAFTPTAKWSTAPRISNLPPVEQSNE